MDVILALKAIINYNQEILSIQYKNKSYSSQLYSKSQLKLILEDEISDDDDSSLVLYSAEYANLADCELTELSEFPEISLEKLIKVPANLDTKKQLELMNLINQYKEIFVTHDSKLQGIKNSEFLLKLENNVTPISAYPR
ncbi:hypothetical protein BB558_006502, partial [Smittium angustum]